MEGFQLAAFASLYSIWAVITIFLVVALGYWATLVSGNDRMLFETGKANQYEAREEPIARKSRLQGAIIVLSVASGFLLAACAGLSVYQGFLNI